MSGVRDNEFKAWLEQGGAQSDAGHATRLFALRTIERNLARLGLNGQTLDEAWRGDQFEQLIARLREILTDARAEGEQYRILMPDSDNPNNRLSNWIAWLKLYGRFLAGEPPGPVKDADRIRSYVIDHYIEPARTRGEGHVEVLVRDVNEALGLNEAWPNICQALGGPRFQALAQVREPARIGAPQSSATRFRFDLGGAGIDRAALERMRRNFLAICPDFKSFLEPGEGWAQGERDFKLAASARVQAVLTESGPDEDLGRSIFEILKTAGSDSPLVRWQTEDSIAKVDESLLSEFYAIIGRLVWSDQPTGAVLASANDAFKELRSKGATALTLGERLNVISAALSMVRPGEMAPLKITRINQAWVILTGEKAFLGEKSELAEDYSKLANGVQEIMHVMRQEWRWEPQDWLDVQGFLWVVTDPSAKTPADIRAVEAVEPIAEDPMSNAATNLILYGPPGTGKTYATAAEAVRLCGEPAPADRAALMEVYDRLLEAGRIAFVTFHQSVSYEEFIEGLRPETGRGDEQDSEGQQTDRAGFRLKIEDGVFKRMCDKARLDPGEGDGDQRLDRGKPIFKVALGRRSHEEAYIQDALGAGEIRIGWGGSVDWSEDRFDEYAEIKVEWEAQVGKEVSGHAGDVVCTFSFRADMQVGDYVAVSDGRDRVRAIGRVTSDYFFEPGASHHPHRRKVQWLWRDDEGVERDRFYPNFFRQHTVYKLNSAVIDWDGLEEVVFGVDRSAPPEDAKSYVLIIDEINRANISKVFGELITLLEPDKRLRAENEIRLTLPYSKRPFGVPANLHVIGTMNTADRSIALLDTALRRRFTFCELMPDPSVLEEAGQRCGVDLPGLLRTLNERIEYLYDREHQIGHAYFIACADRASLDSVMRNKVIPLLAEYFFEDWSKIAAVLGDLEPHDGPIQGGFLRRDVLIAPPGFEDGDAAPRFRWTVKPKDEGFDYAGLTGP